MSIKTLSLLDNIKLKNVFLSYQAFMMMMSFGPRSNTVAFDDPQVIQADVYENGELSLRQNVTIFSNTIMKWRGECFVTTGLFNQVL